MRLASRCVLCKRPVWVTPDVPYRTVGDGKAIHVRCLLAQEAASARRRSARI
jgi:hypothetical protein